MTRQLLIAQNNGVLQVTLNRPERRNALTNVMLGELVNALSSAAADPAVRVIVLKGADRDFSSGFDLEEGRDLDAARQHAEQLVTVLLALVEAPFVSVAIAQGFTLAGGGAIAAATDFAVAVDGVKFGYPVLKVGVVPTPGVPLLRRQLRDRDLRELVFGGELKGGDWALEKGLVNALCADSASANAAVEKFASAILASSPAAVRATKRFTDRWTRTTLRQELEEALSFFMEVREGPEAQEGLNAFAEKRLPSWS
jgi:enoyl-CoA hydratase/carnithine racemase